MKTAVASGWMKQDDPSRGKTHYGNSKSRDLRLQGLAVNPYNHARMDADLTHKTSHRLALGPTHPLNHSPYPAPQGR